MRGGLRAMAAEPVRWLSAPSPAPARRASSANGRTGVIPSASCVPPSGYRPRPELPDHLPDRIVTGRNPGRALIRGRPMRLGQCDDRAVECLRSFGLFGLWQLWQSSGPGGRVHFMIAEKSSDVKVKRVSRLAESKSRCCISHNFGGFYQIIPCIRPAVVRIKVAHGCPATIRIFILGRAVQSSRYLPLQPCSRLPDCCPLNEVGCSWILMTFAPGHRNSPTRSGTRLTRRSWMNLVRWSPCLLKTRTTGSWL